MEVISCDCLCDGGFEDCSEVVTDHKGDTCRECRGNAYKTNENGSICAEPEAG